MNKIVYLAGAVVVIAVVTLALSGGEEVKEVTSGDSVENANTLSNQEADSDAEVVGIDSAIIGTAAIDEDSDSDDFGDTGVADTVDNDCDDPHGDTSACAPDDPVPGIGISDEQESDVSRLDSDDDDDSVPTEDSAAAASQSSGYIKIGDIEGN